MSNEREQFEAWYDRQPHEAPRDTLERTVLTGLKDAAWEGWQYRAALSAPPAGYVLVPREPTEAMYEAGDTAFEGGYVNEMWAAMIAAAPPAQAQGESE